MHTPRKDLHLSLSQDQYDDLTSALETHRNELQRFADSSSSGFGLDLAYWTRRVDEVQELLDSVRRLAAGESPDTVNEELHQRAQEDRHQR